MASFFASPGILTERMHVFLAYDLEKREQALDQGEDIQLLPTKLEDALEMIRVGEIADSKTIASLLMYERFHRQ